MIKFLQKYFRLKMKYQVEAERYQALRHASIWQITETGVPGAEPLRGVALDRALDDYSIKVHRVQIEGLNKALNETSGYDSAISYIKARSKHELAIIEIEERWS